MSIDFSGYSPSLSDAEAINILGDEAARLASRLLAATELHPNVDVDELVEALLCDAGELSSTPWVEALRVEKDAAVSRISAAISDLRPWPARMFADSVNFDAAYGRASSTDRDVQVAKAVANRRVGWLVGTLREELRIAQASATDLAVTWYLREFAAEVSVWFEQVEAPDGLGVDHDEVTDALEDLRQVVLGGRPRNLIDGIKAILGDEAMSLKRINGELATRGWMPEVDDPEEDVAAVLARYNRHFALRGRDGRYRVLVLFEDRLGATVDTTGTEPTGETVEDVAPCILSVDPALALEGTTPEAARWREAQLQVLDTNEWPKEGKHLLITGYRRELWKDLKDPDGLPFTDLEAFRVAPRPFGLGESSPVELNEIIRHSAEEAWLPRNPKPPARSATRAAKSAKKTGGATPVKATKSGKVAATDAPTATPVDLFEPAVSAVTTPTAICEKTAGGVEASDPAALATTTTNREETATQIEASDPAALAATTTTQNREVIAHAAAHKDPAGTEETPAAAPTLPASSDEPAALAVSVSVSVSVPEPQPKSQSADALDGAPSTGASNSEESAGRFRACCRRIWVRSNVLLRAREESYAKLAYEEMQLAAQRGGAPGKRGGGMSKSGTVRGFVRALAAETGCSESLIYKDLRIWARLEPTVRDILIETKVAGRTRDLYDCARLSHEAQLEVLAAWDKDDVKAFSALVSERQPPKSIKTKSFSKASAEEIVAKLLTPIAKAKLVAVLTCGGSATSMRDALVELLASPSMEPAKLAEANARPFQARAAAPAPLGRGPKARTGHRQRPGKRGRPRPSA